MTKKKTEKSKEFKRFDDLLRTIVTVPKDEIKKREAAEKRRKEAKKE